jgi:hypothetical protein
MVSGAATAYLGYQNNQIQSKLIDIGARVSLNLDQYDSDYSSSNKQPPYNLTIRVSNAGPGTAEGMRVGITRHGDQQQIMWGRGGRRSLGPSQPAHLTVMQVDAVYLSDLPPVDPKYILWVWVEYQDIPGKSWIATYDPTMGTNSGLSVSPAVVRSNPFLPSPGQ